jgi:hypothetical protein
MHVLEKGALLSVKLQLLALPLRPRSLNWSLNMQQSRMLFEVLY